ncbi:unknown protein [Simkania negevensis Z]|uniref:Uncharacterized protein n=1 Tax=Simkania negevensis (strain ATCC VR-1471 / DSM 27360 / Z) TaxID=331113 RepID=F8L648_SIMNZ|nr:unknown protein [Simkania negevensis Z]
MTRGTGAKQLITFSSMRASGNSYIPKTFSMMIKMSWESIPTSSAFLAKAKELKLEPP